MTAELFNTKQPEKHTDPKVSIGMPVFNGEKFIRKALDSLLTQTLTDFELIISDNASTDRTANICKEYAAKDKRITYTRQPENMGMLWNFSFVLNEAKAKYFMWAACDDIWDKGYIGQCVNYLDNKPDVGIVYSRFWVLSRMYPFVRITRFPNMSFLCNDDPFIRVGKFIELDGVTHKANAIYGIWRKNIAKQTIVAFDDVDESFVYLGLDIVQIVYLLSMYKCFQIPSVLFYKTYKRFPPGHWLNIFIRPYVYLKGGHLSKECRIANLKKHFELLQMSLKRSGVWDINYKNMLNANYEKAKKHICEAWL